MRKKDFQLWLAENDHLEFSRLLEINESPLELIIGYEPENEVNSGFLNRIALRPLQISHWGYEVSRHFTPSVHTEIRMVEIKEEVEDKIALTFYHAYSDINLTCEAIDVEQLSPIKVQANLTFTETRVTLSAPPQPLIEPAFWLRALAEKDMNACFRHFGGSALELAKVPKDYTGYFITKVDRLSKNNRGVFIAASKSAPDSMYLILECQDKDCLDLWISMISIFAKIEHSKILFNDVLISGDKWLRKYESEFKKRV